MKEILRKKLYAYLDTRDEFKKHSFVINKEQEKISKNVLDVARQVSQSDNKPITMILGVMPRAGTVFMGHLLSLHEKFHLHPNELWEVPVLSPINNLLAYERDFFSGYPPNRDRMLPHDLLPLFGCGIAAYFNHFVEPGKQALIKETDVQNLNYLPTLFPGIRVLLMLRDGRDLVHSTIKSWPHRKFDEVCHTWATCTQSVIDFNKRHQHDNNVMLVKFENVLDEKEKFVRDFCAQFNMNTEQYAFDKINDIGVLGSSTLKKGENVDWKPIEKPKGFRPTGHWLNWSVKQKQVFKKIAGDVLIASGYATDQLW